MSYMRYYINDVEMPSPEYDYDEEDNNLDGENAGRDEIGVLHRDIIRTGVGKWVFDHRMLTQAQKLQLRNLCRLSQVAFKLIYIDGHTETATVHGRISGMKPETAADSLFKCTVAWVEL